MPSPDDLKAILEAQFDLDTCAPQDRLTCQRQFDLLVDQVLRGTHCTRHAFLEAVAERYRSYRRQRLNTERLRQQP